MKKLILFTFLVFSLSTIYGQGTNTLIADANPFCSDTGILFANTSDGSAAESSGGLPNYGCLGSQPNPSWFFIKIDQPGNLTLRIEQNTANDFTGTGLDVDFIAWGPFSLLEVQAIQAGNHSPLNTANTVDCSFSAAAVETLNINGALADQYYLILITNFDGAAGFIKMEEANPGGIGTGSTDCSIIAGDLGLDQDVCEGTVITLDGTPTTGTAVSYKWFVDTGSGFTEIAGATNATLVINNDVSGTYKVEVTDVGGDTGDDEVVITFHPQPVATKPADLAVCDTDGTNDGFFSFDLQALFAADILNGQDPTIYNVAFYASQANADSNTNALTNPYTNATAFTAETIYARVLNTASPGACAGGTTDFQIRVDALPTLQNPADYELCDDATDGDDTNGFVSGFILSTKDTEVLGSLNPADYTVSYHDSQNDADNNLDPIDKANPYTNITANSQGIFVRVENNTTNCVTTSTGTLFNLVVNPLPVITPVVTLELCDTDQDGFASFNLTLANPGISADFANETFRYYPTQTDAENNTDEILNPTNYINTTNTNDAVWVRTITVNGCLRISQITLQVTNTVIPTTFQRTFNECDDYLDINGNDNTNNDDTDGITTFDFSSVTADITALFPAIQTINVTYYTSLADANAPMNPIPDSNNYRNIGSPNSQQIYIRVENPADASCIYIGTHITLIVDPVPTAQAVPTIELCDDDADGDDTNGIVQSFDLDSQSATILGTQNPADYTVTYHESQVDATAGANAITSPFTNTVANGQTIYVRVTNNTTGCYTDRTSFDIIVRPLPITSATVELKQCDNDTDGFSDFNLNEVASDISTNHMNETFIFYPTLADAQADSNAISPADALVFTNRTVTTDIVWARAISTFGCYRISEVTLTVSTTGIPSTFQRVFNVCDDFLDIDGNDTVNNNDTDGVSSFDFSSVTAEIRALFPPTQQLTITYYRNQADALAEVNNITDPTNYRNIGYPNSQGIYVRVDSDLDNDCLGFGIHITLNVDPVPTAAAVPNLELCDDATDGDGTNGIVQTFNLDNQTTTILGGQNPADYTVTYHTSAADANSGASAITTTAAYTNITPNSQTIYVRVTNNTTMCFTDHTSFDIIVNPLPIANFVADLEICDDDTDGSAQNGFSQSFDLESQTATILGSQDPAIYSVTYHASLADAQAGSNTLGSPFSNTVPFSQIIYVRVFNSATNCANGISNFNAIVNPEPTNENVSNLSYCDDDTDGDDTNGFVQNIDLDSLIQPILGDPTVQDEDDFTVTFHESQADATSGAGALNSPYSNTIAGGQTIYVRILNKDTGCVNDDFTFDVIIHPLPDFQVTSPQIVCLNGPPLTISVENPAAIYDYVWTDPSGNNIIGSQITVTSGGLYSVTATTTNGTGCTRTREIQVNESIIATITENDVTIVDDSENNSITIDPTNLGIGDYEYALTDENNQIIRSYQDSPVFENLDGGFYIILVRDKNGCGTARLLVSVVTFPKFFTPNNDGVNDTWAIKGANSTFFPTSQIYIFNRFGKVMGKIDIDNPGWNGTFNGKVLPSDDYWFSISLIDRNGVKRERKGNMSLLRR